MHPQLVEIMTADVDSYAGLRQPTMRNVL